MQDDHRGVWYKLDNLGIDSCITASTLGSELDTVLAVYDIETRFRAGGCESIRCLNSNNNLPPSPDRNESDATKSQVFWKSEKATEPDRKDYYLFVGGYSGLIGNYNLSVRVGASVCLF